MSHASSTSSTGGTTKHTAIPPHVAGWVVLIILGLIVGLTAYNSNKKDRAERLAHKATALDLITTHYATTSAATIQVVVGKTEVGLPPGGFTGCVVAKDGHYFAVEVAHRYRRTLETRADCAVSGSDGGWVSTTNSQYRPRSFSVKNNGREAATIVVWLLPDSYRANG